MGYSMSDLIAIIERDFPDLRWLVRSCDADEPMQRYFAHICNKDYSKTHKGRSDVSAEEALTQALAAANAGINNA
jgi:hypothetical protein